MNGKEDCRWDETAEAWMDVNAEGILMLPDAAVTMQSLWRRRHRYLYVHSARFVFRDIRSQISRDPDPDVQRLPGRENQQPILTQVLELDPKVWENGEFFLVSTARVYDGE